MSKNYKLLNTFIALGFGLFWFLVILFFVFFPIFTFSLDKDIFFQRELNNKEYLQTKLPGGYPFYKFTLNLKAKNGLEKIDSNLVYQNDLVLYPVVDKISDLSLFEKKYLNINKEDNETKETNFQKGMLLADKEAVYFITQAGTYRAFASPEIFDKLGFSWDKITKIDKKDLLNLNKDKNITRATTYLPGSYVKIIDKLYLILENKLVLLNGEEIQNYIQNKFSIIEIDKDSVGQIHCSLKNKNQASCQFTDYKRMVKPNAKILIAIPRDLKIEEAKIKIYTFSGFNKTVPVITLRNMYRHIMLKYGEEIKKYF